MKKVLLILFLLISYTVNAQNFQWVRNQTHNIQFNPDLTAFPSKTDNQGNVILSAIHNFKLSYGSQYYGDVALKKYSSTGSPLYTKILIGKAVINYVQTDVNNNVYIAGSFMDTLKIDSINSISNTGSGFNLNYFIVKLNSSGSVVWKKNLNADYTGDVMLTAIKVKGNALFTGYITNFTQGFIKKFDLNGNETMSILQTPVRSVTTIDVDTHGNIYAGGACSSGNINFGNLIASTAFSYNVYFVKYNPSGNGIWARFVEDITFQEPELVCDNSGNVYAAGFLFDSFMFGTIQAQGPQWLYDFFLTKIDSSGTFLWLREVPNVPGGPSGDAGKEKVNNLLVDAQNNVYISGFTRGTVNWGNNVVTWSSGTKDILILKYTSDGNIIWGKTAGGLANDRVDEISMDNSGNIFISGNFALTSQFDTITVIGTGYINSYVTKMLPGPVTGIGNNSTELSYRLYQNYPNPFNPVTNIAYNLPNNSKVLLKVFDIRGREIITLVNETQTAGYHTVQFDAGILSSGTYFYRIATNNGQNNFEMTKKMLLIK